MDEILLKILDNTTDGADIKMRMYNMRHKLLDDKE